MTASLRCPQLLGRLITADVGVELVLALVWTVLGAVDVMNLDRFKEAYRLGGRGPPGV